MTLIADVIVFLAAAAAAFYCMVLARRLNRLNRLDDGLGAAIAALSAQVGDLTDALEKTRGGARDAADVLVAKTGRAEIAIKRMELLMAALHDLPDCEADRPRGETGHPAAQRGSLREPG